MHPGTLLASLTVAAGVAGWWCWTSYEKNSSAGRSASVSAKGPDLADPSAGTYAAAESNRVSARSVHERILKLEPENTKLRRDLAAALGADVSAPDGTQDKPSAYPLPEALADNTRVTSLDQEAAIRVAFTRLQNRLDELEAEHTDLAQKLNDAIEAKKPPPTPSEVASRLVSLRELTFSKIPEFIPAPTEEIIRQVSAAGAAGIDPAAAAARARAWECLGFVPKSFDFPTAAGSIAAQKNGGYYDAENNRFYYQQDASLSRSDSRDAFAGALIPALLQQNFPTAARPPALTENDDAQRALTALAAGDANFSRVRFSIADQLRSNFDRGQAPAAPPPTPNAPPFMQDVWKWTESQGDMFVQALFAKGGLKAVNEAYARPPKSSAEILHPETLYLAQPPFQPATVELGDTTIAGTAPLAINTAGELGAYYLIRAIADVDYATKATEGWAGDRYAVWPGPEAHGDHSLWRSVWQTPEDAREFFDALRRMVMQRHKIPHQAEYDATPGQFRVDDPHRIIRIVLDQEKKTVTFLDASDPAFAKAAEARGL